MGGIPITSAYANMMHNMSQSGGPPGIPFGVPFMQPNSSMPSVTQSMILPHHGHFMPDSMRHSPNGMPFSGPPPGSFQHQGHIFQGVSGGDEMSHQGGISSQHNVAGMPQHQQQILQQQMMQQHAMRFSHPGNLPSQQHGTLPGQQNFAAMPPNRK